MDQFYEIEPGVFLGPQPTEQDLARLKEAGVRTVIDFRMPNETAVSNEDMTKKQGLDYVNIPVNKAQLSDGQIKSFDSALADHPGPLLLHCATGQRAATMFVLNKAIKNKLSVEDAFAEARKAGFDLAASPATVAFARQVVGAANK